MAFKDTSKNAPPGNFPMPPTADAAQVARGKHAAPNFAAKAEHDSGSLKVAIGKQDGGMAPQQYSVNG